MKRSLITIILGAFAITLVIGLGGCNRNSNPVDSGDPTLSMMVAANIQDDVSDVTDANVDNNTDMLLVPKYDDTQAFQIPMMTERMMRPGFINFLGIMRRETLSDSQKVAIRGMLVDYRACIRDAQLILRASERVIIDSANVQRRAVMQQFRDTLITRTQAITQLRTISLQTRQDLLNNPARATFQASHCTCLQTLFADIRATLTADQQTQWDAWVATLANPCFS